MAEEIKPEVAETNVDVMEVENPAAEGIKNANGDSEPNEVDSALNLKRSREEDDDGVLKKMKGEEKSVEEEQLEKAEGADGGDEESGPARLGPKSFVTGVEMFDYFCKFLHNWPHNLDVNEYEHMVFLDLIKKGHPEPDKKLGGGDVRAFQIRFHPMFKNRCFFLIKEDGSVDDFSYRKYVNNILPLPENMIAKSEVNKAFGGRGGRGHRGGGRGGWGRGRGGRSRNN